MMLKKNDWINHTSVRILQHVCFWLLSFYTFLYLFRIGSKPERIDYIYTALFHSTLIPCVYIHLLFLLPKNNQPLKKYWVNILVISLLVLVFSWINYSFFNTWSNVLLPD